MNLLKLLIIKYKLNIDVLPFKITTYNEHSRKDHRQFFFYVSKINLTF